MFVDNEIARASLKASPADETDHPDGLIRNFNLGSAPAPLSAKVDNARAARAVPLDVYIRVHMYVRTCMLARIDHHWRMRSPREGGGEGECSCKSRAADAIKTNRYHYYALKVWSTIKYLILLDSRDKCVFFFRRINANNLSLVYIGIAFIRDMYYERKIKMHFLHRGQKLFSLMREDVNTIIISSTHYI